MAVRRAWQDGWRSFGQLFDKRAARFEAEATTPAFAHEWLRLFAAIDRMFAEVCYALAGGRKE